MYRVAAIAVALMMVVAACGGEDVSTFDSAEGEVDDRDLAGLGTSGVGTAAASELEGDSAGGVELGSDANQADGGSLAEQAISCLEDSGGSFDEGSVPELLDCFESIRRRQDPIESSERRMLRRACEDEGGNACTELMLRSSDEEDQLFGLACGGRSPGIPCPTIPSDPSTQTTVANSNPQIDEQVVETAIDPNPDPAPPAVGVSSSHPNADAVADQLALFVEGINSRNYKQAFDVRVEGFRGETLDDFAAGNSTSTILDFEILRIRGDAELVVTVSFQSLQSSELSYNNASDCTDWVINYDMVQAPVWRIRDARLVERSDCALRDNALDDIDPDDAFDLAAANPDAFVVDTSHRRSFEIIVTDTYDPWQPVPEAEALHPSWVPWAIPIAAIAGPAIQYDSILGLYVDPIGGIFSSDANFLYLPWLDRLIFLQTGQIYDPGVGWYYPPPPPGSSSSCSVISYEGAGLGSEVLGIGCS